MADNSTTSNSGNLQKSIADTFQSFAQGKNGDGLKQEDDFEPFNFDNVLATSSHTAKTTTKEDEKASSEKAPMSKPPVDEQGARDDKVSKAITESKRELQKARREAESERKAAEELRKKVKDLEEKLAKITKDNLALSKAHQDEKNRADATEGKLQFLNAQLSSGEKGTQEIKTEFEQQISDLHAKVSKSQEERDEAQSALTSANNELKAVQERIEEMSKELISANEETQMMEKLKDKQIHRLQNLLSSRSPTAAGGNSGSEAASLQIKVAELEAENSEKDKQLSKIRSEEKKKMVAQVNAMREKYSKIWKDAQGKMKQKTLTLTKTKQELEAHKSKLKLARQAITQNKNKMSLANTNIKKLENLLKESKSANSKLQNDRSADKASFDKEKQDVKEKLDKYNSLSEELEKLQKERDQWFDQAVNLTATIEGKVPLQTGTLVKVVLPPEYKTEQFAIQWFRSSKDGSFRVIEGSNKYSHYLTCDDLGCVLKVLCTVIETGLTTSAFTGRVTPHVKLLKHVKDALVKDSALMALGGTEVSSKKLKGKPVEKFILITKHKIKIKWGKETKQKGFLADGIKVSLDKTPNTFKLQFKENGIKVNLSARTPFERDMLVLTIRAFVALFQYKERQKKLHKNERDLYTAPLPVILMSVAGGKASGMDEKAHMIERQSRMTRTASRRMSRVGQSATEPNKADDGLGVVGRPSLRASKDPIIEEKPGENGTETKKDEAKATTDGKEKAEGENNGKPEAKDKKKKDKDRGGISLEKYGLKNDVEWDSSDEEEKQVWKNIKIGKAVTAEDEPEGDKNISIGLGLAAPQKGARERRSTRRPRTPKTRNSRTKMRSGAPISASAPMSPSDFGPSKSRGKRKSKLRKNRTHGGSSKLSGSKSKGSEPSTPVDKKKSPGKEKKSQSKSPEPIKEEEKEVNENPKQEPKSEPKQEPKQEPKPEPKPEPKGVDIFFSSGPAPTPINQGGNNNGITVFVNEVLNYTVKGNKVTKIGLIEGEVKASRVGEVIGVRQMALKLGKGKQDVKFNSFVTPFQSDSKGKVTATIPTGQKTVTCLKYSIPAPSNRVPLLAAVQWKMQPGIGLCGVNWFSNGAVPCEKMQAAFLLNLVKSKSLSGCRGMAGVVDKAKRAVVWSKQMAAFDPHGKRLKWDQLIQGGGANGQLRAEVKGEGIAAGGMVAQLKSSTMKSSLSGVETADANSKPLKVVYSFVANVTFDA